MFKLSLSARAESTHDVNMILHTALDNDEISNHIVRYEMTNPSLMFPDVHFHVTFVASDLPKLRTIINDFITIAENQDDAHRFVQTLTFADEFDDGNFIDYESDTAVRIASRMDAKVVVHNLSIGV